MPLKTNAKNKTPVSFRKKEYIENVITIHLLKWLNILATRG